MNIILISGPIGSGKSVLLSNTKFLKKLRRPHVVISTDILAKELYSSKISGYKFQKNPYLRRCVRTKSICRGGALCPPNTLKGRPQGYAPTWEIDKAILRKYLFISPSRELYWDALENILHPQVSQKISEYIGLHSRKKGTFFIECAIPEKLAIAGINHMVELKKARFSGLQLMRKRNISAKEYAVFYARQNMKTGTEKRCG